jgi:hypothetical protein
MSYKNQQKLTLNFLSIYEIAQIFIILQQKAVKNYFEKTFTYL